MRLFLASYISHPDTLKKLDQCVEGLASKKIAYIPTAANAEDGRGVWKTKSSTWDYINSINKNVEAVELEDYRDDSVIEKFRDKDVVWFAGGMTGYLAYWARRCSLDLLLPDILKEDKWYVGSSAGAMLAGKSIGLSEMKSMDSERGAGDIKPLNLVDFDILPHYQESFLPEINENYKKGKLYLLKDGEEIIVENDNITVIGEERIILK